MISLENITLYQGTSMSRGRDFLHVPPHNVLKPYISNYTISFPTPLTMSDEYTILPTSSSTLTICVSSDSINSGLRGVNTKACNVGAYANRMRLLLLIEFHPGGLYPFIRIDQFELVDSSFSLNDLDKTLTQTLENVLLKSVNIEALVEAIDRIFIARLPDYSTGRDISTCMNSIVKQHGNISVRDLSSEFCYSEKHIRRLFLNRVGSSPKMFSRIVRVNYALRLMQNQPQSFTNIAVQAGFFDQPHFIHDFKAICGLTPQEYIQKISVFYNDTFKM